MIQKILWLYLIAHSSVCVHPLSYASIHVYSTEQCIHEENQPVMEWLWIGRSHRPTGCTKRQLCARRTRYIVSDCLIQVSQAPTVRLYIFIGSYIHCRLILP